MCSFPARFSKGTSGGNPIQFWVIVFVSVVFNCHSTLKRKTLTNCPWPGDLGAPREGPWLLITHRGLHSSFFLSRRLGGGAEDNPTPSSGISHQELSKLELPDLLLSYMRYTHVEENGANNAVAGDWCLKWSGKCGEVYHHPVPCPAANSAPALPSLPTINSVPALFTT